MTAKKQAKPFKSTSSQVKGKATAKKPQTRKTAAPQVLDRTSQVLKPGSEPKPPTNPHGLTPKQAAFVHAYQKTGNATQAARAAGYSAKSASSIGEENLRKPEIRAVLDARTAEVVEKHSGLLSELDLTEARIIKECARLAFFDPRKLFDEVGNPIALPNLDDDTAAAIAGVDVLEEWEGSGEDRVLIGHVKKYKVADKNSSLERAAKILGMFKKHQEQPAAPLVSAIQELLAGMGPSALQVVKNPPKADAE
jgi:phage terminase small subunit